MSPGSILTDGTGTRFRIGAMAKPSHASLRSNPDRSAKPLALGRFRYRISAPVDSSFQSGGASMAVVSPLPKEKAAPELHETYEGMIKRFGKVPNIFGAMAHRPNVLKNFLPFYGAVMNEGTVEPRFKELAYLKTSLINACEY